VWLGFGDCDNEFAVVVSLFGCKLVSLETMLLWKEEEQILDIFIPQNNPRFFHSDSIPVSEASGM